MFTCNLVRSPVRRFNHLPSIIRSRITVSSFTWSSINQGSPLKIKKCPRYRHPTPIRSDLTGFTFLVTITTGVVVISLYLYNGLGLASLSNSNIQLAGEEESQGPGTMAGEVLPGRPGNLTADQEAKLQEMWTATLSVFGVPVVGEGMNGDVASTAEPQILSQARVRTSELEKKKKKRTNLFSRKHEDDSAHQDANNASAMDGDDKYGHAKDFQKLLSTQSPEDLRNAFWSMVKHDDPDGLLLRFLRARKWNVTNALIMLVAAMHWRMQEMHVDDDIIRRGEGGSLEDSTSSNAETKKEGEDFLAQMRLGKSFLHGTDRDGRPMCFVRVRLHKQGEQTESSVERYTVYTIETARYLLTSNIDTAVSRRLLVRYTDAKLSTPGYRI